MFGSYKVHHHGRPNRTQRDRSTHKGRYHHGHAHSVGHTHIRRKDRWSRGIVEIHPGYDHAITSERYSAVSLPLEKKSAMGATVCPFCENQCLLDDPGCRKGEAYARSLKEESGGRG